MLIVKRKAGEAVKIGESIVRVQKAIGVIKLSIDAPETIRIEREEMIKSQKARKKC